MPYAYGYLTFLSFCFLSFGLLWRWWTQCGQPMPETPTKRCHRSKGRTRSFVWVRRKFDFRSSPRWGRERWRSIT